MPVYNELFVNSITRTPSRQMFTFDTGSVRNRPSLELNPYAISFKIGLKLLSLPFEIPNDADIHDPINTTI